ncbi:hypothetical protein CJ255_06595 [Candidatus Viridilinea mediisalina]|uniref:Uncharacterized protein n=1 Tax=Candidatus Viridilinea mediisalina TaxID=2024553 RepID=A0A2A6RL65_9CHLR|nr:hypothetical protein CJ255_06595 [Candidatus Viridilinea mediisalina]
MGLRPKPHFLCGVGGYAANTAQKELISVGSTTEPAARWRGGAVAELVEATAPPPPNLSRKAVLTA